MINEFLRSQPDGGIPNYNLMGTIGTGIMYLLVIFYLVWMWVKNAYSDQAPFSTKDKIFSTLKGVVIAGLGFYSVGFFQTFLVWYRVGFDPALYNSQPANLALGFTLLPLLAWLCAMTFNTSVGYAGDLIALAVLGYHVAGRSGCLFGGCCYGFPCEWGWYSTDTGANQFPTSLVESLLTLGIIIFLLIRICRKGYIPDGKNLPYFLLIYGIGRFFTETTRESTKEMWLIWRFSDIHIHMILMALVGGLLLYRNIRKEKATVASEEPQLPELKAQRH